MGIFATASDRAMLVVATERSHSTASPAWLRHFPRASRADLGEYFAQLKKTLTQYYKTHPNALPSRALAIADRLFPVTAVNAMWDLPGRDPKLPLHPHNARFYYGSVAPDQIVLWKQDPDRDPQMMRRTTTGVEIPAMVWTTVAQMQADLAEVTDKVRVEPTEAPVPDTVRDQFLRSLNPRPADPHYTELPPSDRTKKVEPTRAGILRAFVSRMPDGLYVLWTGSDTEPKLARYRGDGESLMVWKGRDRLMHDARHWHMNPGYRDPSEALVERYRSASARHMVDQLQADHSFVLDR